jgi:hypothetical protein
MPNKGPAEYLAMAQQAENAAAEAESDSAKQCWLTIDQEYRALSAKNLERLRASRLKTFDS